MYKSIILAIAGHVAPFVMSSVMGKSGCYLFLTVISMALMSTGSGEVMAISSIIVYDIYKVYINPYRYILNLLFLPIA